MEENKDVPKVFRLNIEVGDLDRAIQFYDKLLGIDGRPQLGERVYYKCGTVDLQIIKAHAVDGPHPLPKALYMTVNDLEPIFERAKALNCVSLDDVHGVSGGDIIVRPWGERSFYAYDPWANPLCFVDAKTVFSG